MGINVYNGNPVEARDRRIIDLETELAEARETAKREAKEFILCAQIHNERGNECAEAVAEKAAEVLNKLAMQKGER